MSQTPSARCIDINNFGDHSTKYVVELSGVKLNLLVFNTVLREIITKAQIDMFEH
jgi:hypothetical protein